MSKVIEIPDEYLPSPEELPGDLALLATSIERVVPGYGVKCTLAIAHDLGGTGLYVHKINKLEREVRNRAIKTDYNLPKMTRRKLAHKYNLCERQIDYILDTISPTHDELKQKQGRLF